MLLGHGAAAGKEGHEEDDTAEDHEDDRDVEVGAVQEIQVVSRPDLNVSPQTNDSQAGQGEQEVEHQDKILDTTVPTTVHVDSQKGLFRLG